MPATGGFPACLLIRILSFLACFWRILGSGKKVLPTWRRHFRGNPPRAYSIKLRKLLRGEKEATDVKCERSCQRVSKWKRRTPTTHIKICKLEFQKYSNIAEAFKLPLHISVKSPPGFQPPTDPPDFYKASTHSWHILLYVFWRYLCTVDTR